VFEINDLVLAALALLTLAVAAGGAFRPDRAGVPTEGSIVYAGIGALIVVVAALIQHPPAVLHRSPQVGAWLALVGAVLITAGGVLIRARVSIVVALKPRQSDPRSTVRVAGRPEGTMPSEPPPMEEAEPLASDETETRPFPGGSGR
jgi:drug/metabolite transporter (DMT)-like permease